MSGIAIALIAVRALGRGGSGGHRASGDLGSASPVPRAICSMAVR